MRGFTPAHTTGSMISSVRPWPPVAVTSVSLIGQCAIGGLPGELVWLSIQIDGPSPEPCNWPHGGKPRVEVRPSLEEA
jgi:hypothetical protein